MNQLIHPIKGPISVPKRKFWFSVFRRGLMWSEKWSVKLWFEGIISWNRLSFYQEDQMWEILDMKCGIIVAYANFNPNKLLVVIYLIYFMSFKRSKCVLSVRLKRLLVKLSKIILFMVIKWPKSVVHPSTQSESVGSPRYDPNDF